MGKTYFPDSSSITSSQETVLFDLLMKIHSNFLSCTYLLIDFPFYHQSPSFSILPILQCPSQCCTSSMKPCLMYLINVVSEFSVTLCLVSFFFTLFCISEIYIPALSECKWIKDMKYLVFIFALAKTLEIYLLQL